MLSCKRTSMVSMHYRTKFIIFRLINPSYRTWRVPFPDIITHLRRNICKCWNYKDKLSSCYWYNKVSRWTPIIRAKIRKSLRSRNKINNRQWVWPKVMVHIKIKVKRLTVYLSPSMKVNIENCWMNRNRSHCTK